MCKGKRDGRPRENAPVLLNMKNTDDPSDEEARAILMLQSAPGGG